MAYEAFISYRRNGGHLLADKLYTELTSNGISTFYDRKELKFVDFKRQLISNNKQSRVLIILLSKDSLNYERCKNKNDWVRRELEMFLRSNRKIIIVKFVDFEMPDKLPPSLNKLKKLLNSKKVITYNPNDIMSEKSVIEEIKSQLFKGLLEKDKEVLKETKKLIDGAMTLADAQSKAMKLYTKHSTKEVLIHFLYVTILLIITISINSFEYESLVCSRLFLTAYGIFAYFSKRSNLINISFFSNESNLWLKTIVVCLFSTLGTIVGFIIILALVILAIIYTIGFMDHVEITIIFVSNFLSTLFSVFIIYEFIKAILHLINAYTSIHYSKMIKKQHRISWIADSICKKRIKDDDTANESIKRKPLAISLCIALSIFIELCLTQSITNYWT